VKAAVLMAASALAASGAGHQAADVRITILSTMLSDQGLGEWGFAALVEVDGKRILFDTGNRPETVLRNAREMKIDLTGIEDVILSHNHGDHTGGLLTLREAYPGSLGRAHVARGIFLSRPRASGEGNPMIAIRKVFEAGGGTFIVHDQPREIAPGVWLTGPIARRHPERNWSMGGGAGRLKTERGESAEDNLPEDMSLVIDTAKGLVVVSGCGHAGIVNTLDYAREKIRKAPIHAAIGGFHLFNAADDHLAWTAAQLKRLGLGQFLGAHCTGIEAVYRIRDMAGLSRRTCAVGGVGGGFRLADGIQPGVIGK